MHRRLWALPGPHRPALGQETRGSQPWVLAGAGAVAFVLPPARGWVLVHYRNVEFRN